MKKEKQGLITNSRDLLSTKEVARIADCSPDDVIVYARRGLISARKMGKFWKITPQAAHGLKTKLKGKNS